MLISRLAESRRFIQVLSGPRQTGKTTLAQQAMAGIKILSHYAIEVKSGRNKGSFPGIEAFSKEFKVKRKLLVGPQGISLEEFLLTPPEELF